MADPIDDTAVEVLVSCPGCGHTHLVTIGDDVIDQGDRLYRLFEASKLLGISRRSLKQAIYEGRIRAEKQSDGPTSPWVISASAIAEFRERRKSKSKRL